MTYWIYRACANVDCTLVKYRKSGFIFAILRLITYIELETAMVINDYRNKPIGPGGGTRRLHQIWLRKLKFSQKLIRCYGGEHGTTVSDHFLVANDNYAEVRLAA